LLEAIERGSAKDKVLPVRLTVRESSLRPADHHQAA